MALKPRKKQPFTEHNRYGALLSTLALFIMLLSFFMMLNAQAYLSKDRIVPTLKSIQEAFTSRVFREDVGPSFTPDIEQSNGKGRDAFESLDSYFKTSFPGSEPRVIPTRGMFFLELDADVFQARLFGDKATLQKTLIEKLWAYQPLQMEIWLNIPDDTGPALSRDREALRARVDKLSSWAVALEKQGLSKGTLTIGLQKGDPKKVIVLFHNYIPYNPVP